MHWNAVSTGGRGYSLERMCDEVKHLPRGQLWRYGQAGDLPGDGLRIDEQGLQQLVRANKGRKGFAYTHYRPGDGDNGALVAQANAQGFTVNFSANNLAHADALAERGEAPVVVVVPPDQTEPMRTPAGRLVAICPASIRDDVTCATCGVCAHPTRKAIIGFPAHGSGKAKAHRVITVARA